MLEGLAAGFFHPFVFEARWYQMLVKLNLCQKKSVMYADLHTVRIMQRIIYLA